MAREWEKKYITYDKGGGFNGFNLQISVHRSNGFDNGDVLGKRFCILIIEEGSGILNYDDKTNAFMSPCVLCINENEHVVIDNPNVKCITIFFHPNAINCVFDFENIRHYPEDRSITFEQEAYWINAFLDRNESYHGYFPVGPLTLKRFVTLAEAIQVQLVNQDVYTWPCRSRSYLIETFFALSSIFDNACAEGNSFFEETAINKDSEMYPVLLYIYNHYNEQLTVADLTSRFGINRTTLTQKMKEAVGDSLISYMNRLRINMAALLLIDTELPVSEIMFRVGFNDSSHFSRVFKKYTGLNPALYKEKNFSFCYGR